MALSQVQEASVAQDQRPPAAPRQPVQTRRADRCRCLDHQQDGEELRLSSADAEARPDQGQVAGQGKWNAGFLEQEDQEQGQLT